VAGVSTRLDRNDIARRRTAQHGTEASMTERWQRDAARNPDEPNEPGLPPGDDPTSTAAGGYGTGSGPSSGGTGDGEAGGGPGGVGRGMDDGTSSTGTGATGEGPTSWLREADTDPEPGP
jgi:hypothetical protein